MPASKSDMIAALSSKGASADEAEEMGPEDDGDDDVMLETHLDEMKAAMDSGDSAAAAAAFRAAVRACS